MAKIVKTRNDINVFIASTVRGFERDLEDLYNMLKGYGYNVIMSHMGTIPLNSQESNLGNCLDAVKRSDVFIGFIRPDYGSGVLEKGGNSITHLEFQAAYKMDIPRFVLVDHRVTFTRNLFRKNAVIQDSTLQRLEFREISFENNQVMDVRCIRMYNDAIKDQERPASKRTGNWVQEYMNFEDVSIHIDAQFYYVERIQKLIDAGKNS